MTPSRLADANLIRIFDFYLAAMFVLSLSRRYAVYWDTVNLVLRLRARYPKLVAKLNAHRGVFLSADVLRPVAVAFALMLTQMLISRVLYPSATITVGGVAGVWWRVAALACSILPMVAVDTYFLVRVARFDRVAAEEYLTLAEHWLNSWKAPAVRAVTLGYIDPRRIVDSEVQKGLTQLSLTAGRTAWWISLQVACRAACGLTIWGLWWSQ